MASTPARPHKRKAGQGNKTAVQPVEGNADVDGHEGEWETIFVNLRPPCVPRANVQRHSHRRHDQEEKPRPEPVSPGATSNCDRNPGHQPSPDPEMPTILELANRKSILYGYPISLLTSPPRNWMPILDKESLIYQATSEVMAMCGLGNAVPMLARRLTWIGKGKAVQPRPQRNRQGKFTRQSAPVSMPPNKVTNPPDPTGAEEWSVEKEQSRLFGGFIEPAIVIPGIDRDHAVANSPIELNVGNSGAFFVVDLPLDNLLAGTETIAFTSLGFYRIYVGGENQPLPLRAQPRQPNRVNWDLDASKVEVEKNRSGVEHATWSVTFLGYEWEEVRKELLDAADAEEEKSKDWVTTMAGYRVVRFKEDVGTHSTATGSGKLLGDVSAPSHPWGRDVIEPPPVGIYANGQYEDVVRNWFPWVSELASEGVDDGRNEDEGGAGGLGQGGQEGSRAVKRRAGSGYGAGVGGSGGPGVGEKRGGRRTTHGNDR